MKCSVIKDLLPLYIDDICSKDTKKLVEGHLAECEECRKTLEEMRKTVELPKLTEEEQREAKMPFKLIQKRGRKQMIAAVLATVMFLGSSFVLVQEVDWLNHIFFPCILSYVNITEEDWQPVIFNYTEQCYSPYGRGGDPEELQVPGYVFVRWKKEIVNGANNEGSVLLRIKNRDGEIISDEISIKTGEAVVVEQLKKGEKYYVEIKAEKAGLYRIAFT